MMTLINGIHYINRIKNKNHLVISINAEKAFDKNPLSFHNKNTQQSRNKGGFSARWKSICEKPTTNIILKGERLNVCP